MIVGRRFADSQGNPRQREFSLGVVDLAGFELAAVPAPLTQNQSLTETGAVGPAVPRRISMADAVMPTRSGNEIGKRRVSRPAGHPAIPPRRLGLELPTSIEIAGL